MNPSIAIHKEADAPISASDGTTIGRLCMEEKENKPSNYVQFGAGYGPYTEQGTFNGTIEDSVCTLYVPKTPYTLFGDDKSIPGSEADKCLEAWLLEDLDPALLDWETLRYNTEKLWILHTSRISIHQYCTASLRLK